MRRQRTLVLLEALRFSDLIEDDDLLNDLVVKLQHILALDVRRAVALQQFQLCPYRLQLIENRLFLRI